jgi:hypothetical protein
MIQKLSTEFHRIIKIQKPPGNFDFETFCQSVSLLRQMMIRLQAIPYELVNFLARGVALDALNDFAGKGMDQHAPGRLGVKAART